MATNNNPAFGPMNFIRDLTSVTFNMPALLNNGGFDALRQGDLGVADRTSGLTTLTKLPIAMRGAFNYHYTNPVLSTLGVKNVKLNKEGLRYKKWREAGAGFSTLRKGHQILDVKGETRIGDILELQFGPGRKEWNALKRAWKKISNALEHYNETWENSTRYAAYIRAKELGRTEEAAQSVSRNVSVNFSRRGTAAPFLSPFFAFYNSAVQGTARSLRTLDTGQGLMTMYGSQIASGLAIHYYNSSIDPNYRNKMSKWQMENYHNILFGDGKYLTLPVPHEQRFMKANVEGAIDMMSGRKTMEQVFGQMTNAVGSNYNPIGGEDLIAMMTPTPLDPAVSAARNKAFTGAPIDYKDLPLADIDRGIFGLTKKQWKYLGEQYIGAAPKLAIDNAFNLVPGQRFIKDLYDEKRGYEQELEIMYEFTKNRLKDVRDQNDPEQVQKAYDYIAEFMARVDHDDRDLTNNYKKRYIHKLRKDGWNTKGITYSKNIKPPEPEFDALRGQIAYPQYREVYFYFSQKGSRDPHSSTRSYMERIRELQPHYENMLKNKQRNLNR